jgi:hypothetical protein
MAHGVMQQIIRPNGQYCAKMAVAGCLLWRKRIGQPLSGVKCLQQLLFASGCIVAGHLLFIWGKISVLWQPWHGGRSLKFGKIEVARLISLLDSG